MKFWKDLSVANKLSTVIGLMTVLVIMELVIVLFVINTLSSLRAFVGGEGSWSKAQKNAIQSLDHYIHSQNENYFEDFKKHLLVCKGDQVARIELLKESPDMELVRKNLLLGQLAPADIPGVSDLIHYFHSAPYVRKAIALWTEADEKINQLEAKGDEIHALLLSKSHSSDKLQSLINDTYQLNRDFTQMENEFSHILGAGSRALEKTLMLTLVLSVLALAGFSLFMAVGFNRHLSRSLTEINEAAKILGSGDFSAKIPVHSNDELGQLANTLNKMTTDLESNILQRVRAENASQIKTLFLANMSHEIRTPLGVILGMTEVIKDPALSTEDRLKYVQIIENTGRNLTRIINDILDITKVESGHLQIQKAPVKVDDTLLEITDMLKLNAENNRNRFEIIKDSPIPEVILTDRSRLQQILINLINNALKFTHDGVIEIRYGVTGNQLHCDIVDNGIGMHPDFQQHIFKIFSQEDSSSTRRYEGTGLGLALSKKIAQSLGGDIQLLKSSPGQGAAFRMTIAIEVPPSQIGVTAPQGAATSLTLSSKLSGRKVLVVDDSTDNQMLIELYLKKKGLITDFAANGQIACEKALQGGHDLILMDMQMPIMDGYSATKALREAGFKKPIIALTANAMTEDRNRCLEVGCNEYLTKPIESGALYRTLANFMND